MPCVDRLDVLARDHAADDLVHELIAGALLAGLELMMAWPYWPLPPVWRMWRPLPSAAPADRLPIGDLRLADVGRDLELADHAVDEHVEVKLAHAGDERLGRLLVRLDAEGRVLLREALEGDRQLVLVGLRLGLDVDLDDRLGEGHRLQDDRVVRVGEGVPREGVLEPDRGGDVTGEDLVDLLAVVGVHLEDAPDALPLVLGRVDTYEPALNVPE